MLKPNTMKTLMTAAVASLSFSAANAQDTTLTISSWAPPTHGVNARMWPDLIERIEAATDGRVTAQIKYNLAPPPAQADIISDGVADIAWIVHNYTPGRFPSTEVFELPFMVADARAASCAYWTMYEENMQEEFAPVHLLGTWVHGPGMFHTAEPVVVPEDLQGMKIRGGSVLVNKLLERVGQAQIQHRVARERTPVLLRFCEPTAKL